MSVIPPGRGSAAARAPYGVRRAVGARPSRHERRRRSGAVSTARFTDDRLVELACCAGRTSSTGASTALDVEGDCPSARHPVSGARPSSASCAADGRQARANELLDKLLAEHDPKIGREFLGAVRLRPCVRAYPKATVGSGGAEAPGRRQPADRGGGRTGGAGAVGFGMGAPRSSPTAPGRRQYLRPLFTGKRCGASCSASRAPARRRRPLDPRRRDGDGGS